MGPITARAHLVMLDMDLGATHPLVAAVVEDTMAAGAADLMAPG